MTISEELEQLFKGDPEQIKSIEVTYRNGGKVKGVIASLKFNPLDLILLREKTRRWESNKHHVVFDHLVEITITFTNDSDKTLR